MAIDSFGGVARCSAIVLAFALAFSNFMLAESVLFASSVLVLGSDSEVDFCMRLNGTSTERGCEPDEVGRGASGGGLCGGGAGGG